MDLDNAINLQAELFRDEFNFLEVPGAMTEVASHELPIFADPAFLDKASPDLKKLYSRPASQIAIGVGAVGSEESEQYGLVAIYQNRSVEKSSLLNRIASRARGDIRLVYAGTVRAQQSWHRRQNGTLRLGSSIGHKKVSGGTLGCFVKHRESGHKGFLSNNHILANLNRASQGDEIRQPGKADGGTTNQRVGSLADFVPLNFGAGSNLVDCAWAIQDEPSRPENRKDIFDSVDLKVGRINGTRPIAALPHTYVLKIGRTTGYTQGIVDAININNLTVNMGRGKMAKFNGQIQMKSLSANNFSAGGDSGSLILNSSHEPVGLLFAGSGRGANSLTWANPIRTVLTALDLDIIM